MKQALLISKRYRKKKISDFDLPKSGVFPLPSCSEEVSDSGMYKFIFLFLSYTLFFEGLTAKRPNVLFILVDDMGARDLK